VTRDQEERRILIEMSDIIEEELNVKDVIFRENEEDLVEYSVKANFRILGKQLGRDMKAAAGRIAELSSTEILSLLEGATLSVGFEGAEHSSIDITQESVVIQRSEKENLKVLNEGALTVALDPEITDDLYQEGVVRDLVRSIQNLRKESGLEVTDRIRLYLGGSDKVKESVEAFEDHLLQETLAEKWFWEEKEISQDVACGDDEPCRLALEKV